MGGGGGGSSFAAEFCHSVVTINGRGRLPGGTGKVGGAPQAVGVGEWDEVDGTVGEVSATRAKAIEVNEPETHSNNVRTHPSPRSSPHSGRQGEARAKRV